MAENMLSFSLRNISSVQIMWILSALIFLLLLFLIYRQYMRRRQLKNDLSEIEKMMQSNVEYEFVLKAMHLATWHVDPKMRTFFFDNDYREDTGNFIPEAGTNIDDWVLQLFPNDQSRVGKALDEICLGESDVFYQQYQVKSLIPGKSYWEESYATVGERDADGNPLKIVGASMRIDNRKDMENALIQARNKAEESDRLKSAFLANMGHEIRTPLNAIVGFADLLPVVQNDEDRNQLIQEIQNNNQKLLRIIDGLVSMSEIEAGAQNLALNAVDLNTLLTALQEQNQTSTEVPILLHLPQSEMLIHSDQEKLKTIMEHFLLNAIKFTTEGSITMGYDVEDSHVRLWVSDTGRGIAKDDQERVFERFVKIDEYVPGTGLGLSVVKSHVQQLGGAVGVDSEPGKGSRFWALLPLT
ncbi:MAG: HAMP domain-containing histidine kinase [Prevotella sp.]|nr:HAMP domain-containing histidine kinase [Prevotella sp.]